MFAMASSRCSASSRLARRSSVFSCWIFSNWPAAAMGSAPAGAGERCRVSSVVMLGKCRREGGVGQAEVTGQGEHGRRLAGGLGEPLDGELDVVVAGQDGAAGHLVSGVWRARNRAIWFRRLRSR